MINKSMFELYLDGEYNTDHKSKSILNNLFLIIKYANIENKKYVNGPSDKLSVLTSINLALLINNINFTLKYDTNMFRAALNNSKGLSLKINCNDFEYLDDIFQSINEVSSLSFNKKQSMIEQISKNKGYNLYLVKKMQHVIIYAIIELTIIKGD